jgi:uncharacterized membrane protein YedE/YeeE
VNDPWINPLAAVADPLAYPGGEWSPYLAGAGIGILSWLTFYVSKQAIGASGFYATLAGWIGNRLAPQHTRSLKYYRDHPPRWNWGFVFLIFTIFGGWLAAASGDGIRNEWLHPMWVDRFGDSIGLRFTVAVGGGILMAFGARLAGGCTSGHGISGTLQLNVGSWIVLICMFLGGTITAMLLYRL